MHAILAQSNQLWYSVPLVVAVSLVYAGTRHENMSRILAHATRLGFWIFFFLAAPGALLWWLGRGL